MLFVVSPRGSNVESWTSRSARAGKSPPKPWVKEANIAFCSEMTGLGQLQAQAVFGSQSLHPWGRASSEGRLQPPCPAGAVWLRGDCFPTPCCFTWFLWAQGFDADPLIPLPAVGHWDSWTSCAWSQARGPPAPQASRSNKICLLQRQFG